MRRGRRHPVELRAGDPLDLWRVEAWEEDRLLRLCAETKVPGRAWVQFEVEPDEGDSRITQTAVFDPLGSGGFIHWHVPYPIHWLSFRQMVRGVARAVLSTVWRPKAHSSSLRARNALPEPRADRLT